MKLYICEKQNQAKDLARVLKINTYASNGSFGSGEIVVTWAIGHLVKALEPDEIDRKYKKWRIEHLPIVPSVWKNKANIKTKKQLMNIKSLLKKSNHVVIATDGDREGECIGREILDYFNWKGLIERLWLTALDDSSIKKALSNIKQGNETLNLYKAALARSRADWLVGMNATRVMSIVNNQKKFTGVVSIGRVQTPTLAIVVNRDKDIENFKPIDYFNIAVYIKNGIKLIWQPTSRELTKVDEANRCVDKKYVQHIVNKITRSVAKVISFKTQIKIDKQPLLYSLSALQQDANKKFGFGAKLVLDLAQALYEKHKATTYPRSNCQYLPKSQLPEAKVILTCIVKADSSIKSLVENADKSIVSRVWNDEKITAHHAIIPTKTVADTTKMTKDEASLYDLIRRSYIAQFYPEHKYKTIKLEVSIKDEVFKTIINFDISLGWLKAINQKAKLLKSDIPAFNVGDVVQVDKIDIEAKKTKPLPRYTEGTLIGAMEKAYKFVKNENFKKILKGNEGIGTEATRANIIELLISRSFINKTKKQLVSSPTGRKLIASVPKAVKDPEMTAIMESSLSKIESGEITLDAFMKWQVDWIVKLIDIIKQGAKL